MYLWGRVEMCVFVYVCACMLCVCLCIISHLFIPNSPEINGLMEIKVWKPIWCPHMNTIIKFQSINNTIPQVVHDIKSTITFIPTLVKNREIFNQIFPLIALFGNLWNSLWHDRSVNNSVKRVSFSALFSISWIWLCNSKTKYIIFVFLISTFPINLQVNSKMLNVK